MGKKPTYEELEQRVKELAQEVVKHKQAEEKLWESEGRFSGMFEHMSSGVAVYESVDNGEDFVFRAFNSAAERITRISRSEALGNRLLDLFPHMDKSGLLGALQRAWETGQEEHLPPFYYKDEIREGWRENRIYKLPTGEVVALFDDVTERKQAEEALRKSEERYRSLFQNAPIGISIVDNEGNILDFNDAMLRLHGYSREDRLAIGRTSEYYYNPEDREKVTAQLLKNGFMNEMEVKFKRKDGTPYDALLSMLPIEIDGKSLWHAMIQDITERKQAEEALRESEEKYRTILESIEDGYFEVDIAGDFTFFNGSLCEILGYSKDELMGMNNRQYTDKENAKKLYQAFNKVYTTGKPDKGFDWVIIRKDGTKRSIEASVSLRRDTEGVPTGFRGVVRDISEKQRIEAHLQQATKMEAIGTLAGGIAHQFNNALSSITGQTGLLEMEYPEDEKIMDYAKAMKQPAHRMAHLTSQLLAYARGGKYHSQPMSLSNFVEGTLPIIQYTLDPDIRVETDLPLDTENVNVDRTQMQMVLSAIIANSNEAIDPPGRIRISTRNMDLDKEFIKDHPGLKPGSYICLSIEDDGKGMDEETKNRIFDPFFTTHFIGRGLGMASVYGIIKNRVAGGFSPPAPTTPRMRVRTGRFPESFRTQSNC